MQSKLIALVDCNNFFVSCERVFRPDLATKPVGVLSNNDGCFVSRSQEVKDIGIPMGAPAFKYKNEIEKHNIHVFSSNFTLYGDMSNRVMSVLETYSPFVEIYSIDEAFLELEQVAEAIKNPTEYAQQMVKKVKTYTGIPVSIGIASTKTLAKIAGSLVKKRKKKEGVFDLSTITPSELAKLFKEIEVGDIWGIGYNRVRQMNENGIYTIFDFMQADRTWLREKFSVQAERIYLELHGTPCFTVDNNPTPRKGIASTRSFGKPVTQIKELKESVSSHITNATRKLRQQKSVAGQITVFIRTSLHDKSREYFSTAANIQIPTPTDDTMVLIKAALRGLEQVFQPGVLYKKVGVYLTDISPKDSFRLSLFTNYDFQDDKRKNLLDSIDLINNQLGKDAIRYGVQGFAHRWKVKAESVSPRYTTSWEEIPTIDIGSRTSDIGYQKPDGGHRISD